MTDVVVYYTKVVSTDDGQFRVFVQSCRLDEEYDGPVSENRLETRAEVLFDFSKLRARTILEIIGEFSNSDLRLSNSYLLTLFSVGLFYLHGHWTYCEKMRLDGTQPDEANDDDYLRWCDTDDLDSAYETASTVADDVSDARLLNQESGSNFVYI